MTTCYDPMCGELAKKELEEVQGIQIVVCPRGHRTGKMPEEQQEASIVKAA